MGVECPFHKHFCERAGGIITVVTRPSVRGCACGGDLTQADRDRGGVVAEGLGAMEGGFMGVRGIRGERDGDTLAGTRLQFHGCW